MANYIKKFFGKFAKNKDSKKNSIEVIEIKTGNKVSYAGYNIGDSEAQEYSQTTALLADLRSKTSIGEQIETIVARDPDVSQSVWAFQRLCMQGVNIEITDLQGNRLPEAENLFNVQCRHWNKLGEDGLDGIIDSLHKVGLLYNVMMVEVVVDNKGGNTFSGIYIVDPRTLEWQLEKRDGVEQWIPYQDQQGNKVDLTKGNVFWVIANPDITKPNGAYLLESAVPAVDYKLQTIRDSSAVLRRQGYPYNVFSINKERVVNSLPASQRNDKNAVNEAIQRAVELASSVAVGREPTQDIVVTDDIEVNRNSNSSAGSSIDTRAWFDTIDVQMLNGCKTLGFLMNRASGQTESWGTVQMKIITDMVKSFQQKSKRLIEDIGAIWLQLNGYQGTLKLTHKPLEYQSEIQKWDAQNKKDEHFKTAEDQGWINIDEAAQGATGNSKATGEKQQQ
ncbi:hypothetical protein [Faecalibacillus faecis]|uniref:phage portal protein family protein n=1 Tax=Faecalibacillus faecis TaxID=1982628 RepID=UPI00386A2059